MSAREWAGRVALGAYNLGRRSGVLDTRAGEAFYMRAYMAYKRHVEDSLSALLRRYPALASGGHVFDVGAHIGYTAILFSQAVDAGFRVHAFEPEPGNFARLKRNLTRFRCENVEAYNCSAGRSEGMATLRLNDSHPGDHRILTPALAAEPEDGKVIDVAMTSLDATWEALSRDPVALVKIDVQGFEYEVILGMGSLLESEKPPVVIFEYDPEMTLAMGFDPLAVPTLLASRGCELHVIGPRGVLLPIRTDALETSGSEYRDVVAVPRWRRLSP